jgi:hypothetical protein
MFGGKKYIEDVIHLLTILGLMKMMQNGLKIFLSSPKMVSIQDYMDLDDKG